MKRPREDEIRIATEAARWQRALESGSPEVRAEFADWVKASPRHLREFMFMEALDSAMLTIDPDKKVDAKLGYSRPEGNVVPLPAASEEVSPPVALLAKRKIRSNSRSRTSSRPARWMAAAASSLGLILGLAWWFTPSVLGGWERYSTAIGEQRTVELDDGSIMQMNTGTRLRVHVTDHMREIRLHEGEALFKVAHDAARPFSVRTDDAVIGAVGTEFNVYRRSSGTAVAVLEGKVTIRFNEPGTEAVRYLAAGEAARVADTGEIIWDAVADISEAIAWRQRRLVFREQTLANIAEEFNRYNQLPQIVVEGASVRSRRYGGTFDADDPDSLVQFLTRNGDLHVERSTERIVIRAQ